MNTAEFTATRRSIGFHEAAHAVVAALLGQKILWTEIHPDGYAETVPDTNIFLRLDEPFQSRRTMLIAMAGSAAQCRCMDRDIQWSPEGGNDKRLVEEIAETAGLSPDDFSTVNAILSKDDVWEIVSRLADALVTCERLEGQDLTDRLPDCDPVLCKTVGVFPLPPRSASVGLHCDFP